MSAQHTAPPGTDVTSSSARSAGIALIKRRHIDLMRVCSDGCRRPTT